jgi:hypothetical protein
MMNEHEALERRVANLIRAYADRAPTDADPMVIAELAAFSSNGVVANRFGYLPAGRLAFALLLLALVAAMAGGALVAGRFLQRDAEDPLTVHAFIEPFTGLPPEGAAPSAPEDGELVLSFSGRVNMLGGDFHRMWLYADGRLIWKSNLEGYDNGSHIWAERFGGSEPTPAVIEQHLAPEGVELIRSDVLASARVLGLTTVGMDGSKWSRPGVIWGGLTLGDGDRLLDADWSDSRLPARLANPGSWLPTNAWQDRRIGGYVPSRYAVCLGQALPTGVTGLAPADVWDLLPEPTRDLIRSKALADPAPDWNKQDPRCLHQVSTEGARAIVAGFDDAGLRRESDDGLSYTFPIGREFPGVIQILVVVPSGEVVCLCG